jgi:hypothetical protein
MTDRTLVKCYWVTLTSQVLEGKEGGLTLINLLEGVNVPKEALGQFVPLELVSFWMLGEDWNNRELEVCVSARASDGSPDIDGPAAKFPVQPTGNIYNDGYLRVKMRAQGFQLPKTLGAHKIFMKWRPTVDSAWTESDGFWWLFLNEFSGPPPAGSPVLNVPTTAA